MATSVGLRPTQESRLGRTRVTRRLWPVLMLVGGAAGVVSGVWQTVERIAFASGGNKGAFCEISSVLSCNSVFDHWQSSALGIPNSLVSIPVFAVLAFAGLSLLMGSQLSRSYLATLFALTVFMAAFLTWYMEQSAMSIGVLCLYCTVCAASVIMTGIGLTRVVAANESLGTGRVGRRLGLLVDSGSDVVIWLGLALLIAVLLYLGLVV